MKVAILGCGPAGLLAAHAANMAGHEIMIISRKRKSEMFGAQYLHRAIPSITLERPEFHVTYELFGSDLGYAEKVYGDLPPDFVSPTRLVGRHDAWDIRKAYDKLWRHYEPAITDIEKLTAGALQALVAKASYIDRWISTIPAVSICYNIEHSFRSRTAWAIGDAPERGIECPVRVLADMVVCDGTAERSWYRASHINDYKTCEWPDEIKPPYEGVAQVTKVVGTNCRCWERLGFWRTGRYGAWDKSKLTHHAYWDIFEAFTAERETRG